MRKTVIFLGVLILFLNFTAPRALSLCVQAGNPFPDFVLKTTEGKEVRLSDYRGKVVFLAFFASWCPRCREELTFLNRIKKENPDLVVLAINQEGQNLTASRLETLKQNLDDWGIEFPVLLDMDLKVWDEACINALPTSVILDREGKIVFAEPNYYWASEEKIASILARFFGGEK
ncbi:MAG: TlpA family protein disulfide reductase [Deltaproteobacteria bacterium]|nr:MAG: TlpA family protein disulfide reductase [Deltaproteobacteria bacterium]